jgi:cell division protease FtsH
MVSFFGMSDKVGNISFYDSTGQADFGFTKPYSEKTAELIDQEVKEIIEESYLRAQDVLRNNMKGLVELAELLLEKEVIFSEDLERIFGKRKADLMKDARDNKEAPEKNGPVDDAVSAEISAGSASLSKAPEAETAEPAKTEIGEAPSKSGKIKDKNKKLPI